jgi:hypothetical protein
MARTMALPCAMMRLASLVRGVIRDTHRTVLNWRQVGDRSADHDLCGFFNLTSTAFDSEPKLAIIGSVLLCARFPTPPNRRAGASDRCRNLYNLKVLSKLLFAVLLFALAAWQEGVMAMVSELGVYFVIAVGSRVQSRT